jgi:phosphoesterase RecJ-like protein
MEAGVDTDAMYQRLYQSERPQRLALQTRAQQSLEYRADGKLAVMTITSDDFKSTGAGVPATENVINVPLQVAMVRVSMLVVEPPEGGTIRISLRSKGDLDVARFCERFGGGGHARAAGMKLDGSILEVREKIADALASELSKTSAP